MLPDGICHPVRNYLCRDNINGEQHKTSGAGLQIPPRFVHKSNQTGKSVISAGMPKSRPWTVTRW